MLAHLSNSVLLEAYVKARQHKLEEDFIFILESELHHRDLHPIAKNKLANLHLVHNSILHSL
ncbi:hypothetical protein JCM19046_4594 [Bacillus sp. JCM 19046]|nr:hypothetical protein JCM19045_3118 [Bacillus sp. JCM 19045]GAF19902.1 hypothetical protein JCM19046_4594 [Bacillus sp. JCM 19046]